MLQPIINRTAVGPAPWPHSKFRLNEGELLQHGGRIQIDPKITVERFRIFCEFVEEHGEWNTTKAKEAGIEDASLIHSSVYHRSNLLPKVYWRPGWGRGTPRRKDLHEPEPPSLVPTSPHLLHRMAKLKEELMRQTERVDDAHNRINEVESKLPYKRLPPMSRFERFRRGLRRRLAYLMKGK